MMLNVIEKANSEMQNAVDLIRNGICLNIKIDPDTEHLNSLYEIVRNISENSSLEEINIGINAISILARERFQFYESKGNCMRYQTIFDFYSEYECFELHRLKLLLPSYLEMQRQAKERVIKRSLERRRLAANK